MAFDQELDILLRARCTLMVLVTPEEERALAVVKLVCERRERACFTWDAADQFRTLAGADQSFSATPDLITALITIDQAGGDGLYVLKDFHDAWTNDEVWRKLHSVAQRLEVTRKSILVTCPVRSIPDELQNEAVVLDCDAVAPAIAGEPAYASSAPPLRAALLALSGRWTEREAFDLGGLHLGAAAEAASPGLRRRLAAAAREAGRAEWVQVTPGRAHRRLVEMTRREWHDVVALLAAPERAAEAWRLAEEAPPFWARTLLLGIGKPDALPECDREDFTRLRGLAELCGIGEIPLSAPVGCVATLLGHENWVGSLAVTPDGSLLASAGWDETIRLWSLPGGEHVATLRGHESLVGSLAVTPDESLLASGSGSRGTIGLWSLPGGEHVATLEGHRGGVRSLAVTPDGSLLVSGSGDRTIRLWRLPDGESVAKLRGHRGGVYSLAVTPDGSLLVSGSDDNTIRLWSLPGGECVATLRGHEDEVSSLVVTPDGSLLASASGGMFDKTVRLWRLPGGEHMATLEGHERWVPSLAVTPDGNLLASGSFDHTIRLWRLPDGECVATLEGHEQSVDSLAVTPDGNLLASGDSDGTIHLWRSEIATLAATPIAALAHDHDPLLQLPREARADERQRAWLDLMLALVARHRHIDIETALRDAADAADEAAREIAASALGSLPEGPDREALCRLAVEEGDAAALALATESAYVPSDPPLRAALLALSGRWTELAAFDLDNVHLSAAYEAAPPGLRRRLAGAAREAGRAEWVQVALGGRAQSRLAAMTREEWQDVLALLGGARHGAEAWRLAAEAPPIWGRRLLLGIGDPRALPKRDREDFARLRALAAACDEEATQLSATASCVATLQGMLDHSTRSWWVVSSLAVTPDGSLLLSGSGDATIRLWSLPAGECTMTLLGHAPGSSILSLALTADGSLLASGSSDATIRLWRLSDGECTATLLGHVGHVNALALTTNGSLLASGGGMFDETLRLWRLPDGECMATLQEHEDRVYSLAVTPDGSLLASGSNDGTICLWRLPDGERAATLQGHVSRVRALAVTPDGSLLASGSGDATVRLWRLPDGECVATLRGHEHVVSALAVTSDGSLLASGSQDKTIRLWRLPDGECVATLYGHEHGVSSLAVTPDGSLLASGDGAGTIRLWRSALGALVIAPIATLARDNRRLLQLQRAAGSHKGAWPSFMLALIDHHRRYGIEIEE